MNNIHRRRLAVNKASIGSKMVKIQGELQPRTMNLLTKILPFQKWLPLPSTNTNFMKSRALPCFTSGESVTSFESIFSPEQGHTKVTAHKFVLVATGL